MKVSAILQNRRAKVFFVWFAVCFFALPSFGQEAAEVRQNEFVEARLYSKLLARETSYRIILPAAYNQSETRRFPVIYLLHGRGGNYRDWTNLTRLAEYSFGYDFIIVTPDGGKESWYADNPNQPAQNYESYFVKELLPEIDRRFRTLADRRSRVVAGLSMGGYGAVKFGLKYPEKFALAGSFSGAMDAVWRTENYPHLIDSVKNVFGETGSRARAENNLFRFVGDAAPERRKEFPFFYIVCGMTDHQFQSNRDFVSLLLEKKVPHEYRQLPGEHNWRFWDQEIQEFLRAANRIASPKK